MDLLSLIIALMALALAIFALVFVFGRSGQQGPPGITGMTGITGKDGPINGITGEQGPQGNQGIPGNIGPDGPPGVQGIKGPPGEGDQPGPPGPPGIPGVLGPSGPPGITGAGGNEYTIKQINQTEIISIGTTTYPLQWIYYILQRGGGNISMLFDSTFQPTVGSNFIIDSSQVTSGVTISSSTYNSTSNMNGSTPGLLNITLQPGRVYQFNYIGLFQDNKTNYVWIIS